MDKLEELLPTIKFTINLGFQREKPRGVRLEMTKDKRPPEMLLFGLIRDLSTQNIIPARGSLLYPELDKLLREIAKEHFDPDFTFTNFQINKNVNCKMHLDKKNKGNACLFTLGDFKTGGHLELENSTVDIYKKPYIFNGNKVLHGTQDWTGGDRYCVIYYTTQNLNQPRLLRSFDILKPEVKTDYLTCNEIFRKNIYKTDRYFKKGEKWLDIGANIGAFTLSALESGCEVIAYEPVERNIAKLKELQKNYNFTLEEVAVLDKSETMPIYLDKGGEWRHTLYKIRGRPSIDVTVIDAINLPDCDGIKIDAEGAELDIIYRLEEFPKYLLFEYDGGHHKLVETFNKLISFLGGFYNNIEIVNPPPKDAEKFSYFPNGITVLCSK